MRGKLVLAIANIQFACIVVSVLATCYPLPHIPSVRTYIHVRMHVHIYAVCVFRLWMCSCSAGSVADSYADPVADPVADSNANLRRYRPLARTLLAHASRACLTVDMPHSLICCLAPHTHPCIASCVGVCVFVCMCVCARARARMCVCVCVCASACARLHVCVCACLYFFVCSVCCVRACVSVGKRAYTDVTYLL